MTSNNDILVLALASMLGNVGVALTGLGMAIIFIFVWQIAIVSGYDGDFKFAIFVQAIALLSIQPIALSKANIKDHASREVLRYFIPITIISTPIGQILGNYAPTAAVQGVGGILILFVSIFQLVKNRHLIEQKINDIYKLFGTDMEEVDLLKCSGFSTGSIHDSYTKTQCRVGHGLTSIVSIGYSIDNRKDAFAVKTIDKKKFSKNELDILKREVFLLSTFSHGNIVSLIESFDENVEMTLIFELMKGEDLFTRLSRRSYFDEWESRRYFKQMLNAVAYIHREKVAHRDIKPEQFLFSSHQKDAVLKLSDFGFAKRCSKKKSSYNIETSCFRTMCGTPCYASPEVLSGKKYGLKTDVWSLGITLYTMLAGYLPFQGSDEKIDINDHKSLYKSIFNNEICFKRKHWDNVSKDAQHFLLSLLSKSASKRLSSKEAVASPWLSTDYNSFTSETNTVFFMIGSQRSGSNWLRTLIDEREDIAAPHPPHIIRDFLPIICKFGDLSIDQNFRVLVDHVCILVERNQVQWNNIHGSKLWFPRMTIYKHSMASLNRLEKEGLIIDATFYLLSIFDAIMTHYADANRKRFWMCKSMGMSMYHKHLLQFYGAKRLRYVYLVRDPRDVVLSFMNTPVGDCHPYTITVKWKNLQNKALEILEKYPHLLYKVRYETLLASKDVTISKLYDFLGIRSFNQLQRQTSIMAMSTIEELIENAKHGKEATKASTLSYQFQNLCKGEEFAASQLQKWRNPSNGLTEPTLRIIESVAFEVMKKLDYEPSLFTCTPPSEYSKADIATFSEMNKEMVNKMMTDLKEKNPDDFARRQHQSNTFDLRLEMFGDWPENNQECIGTSQNQTNIPSKSISPVVVKRSCAGSLKNGRKFTFGYATQQGYDPCNLKKRNQDTPNFAIIEGNDVASLSNITPCFSVFDGHGKSGLQCSYHASQQMESVLSTYLKNQEMKKSNDEEIRNLIRCSFEKVQKNLISCSSVETKLSGTTATVLILNESRGIIANAGDSFCAVGAVPRGSTSNSGYEVVLRTIDHTPFLEDEAQRIWNSNGEICTIEQKEGLESLHTDWRNGDTPRVWNVGMNLPGVAFTRSLGDEIAHKIGVISCPETTIFELPNSKCAIVIGSDGISRYISEKDCMRMLNDFDDPENASKELVSIATQRWAENGDYIDDITVIVIFLESDGKMIQENISEVEDVSSDIEMGVKFDASEKLKLDMNAIFWTLSAGFASGFLGGLCAIRGPPIILYFLNPPGNVSFTKESQRATGTCITFANVLMRVVFYCIETFTSNEQNLAFDANESGLYIAVVASSILGTLIGSLVFSFVKNQEITRGILSFLLLISGINLIISAFR